MKRAATTAGLLAITLLKGKYADNPAKMAQALARETRFREPMTRRKIAVQEAVSGRFGDAASSQSVASSRPTVTP